jgi:ribonuclease T1
LVIRKRSFISAIIWLALFFTAISCRQNNENQQLKERGFKKHQSSKINPKPHSKQNNHNYSAENIPQKAYEIKDYVLKNKQAINGYVGGRKFKNLEKILPNLEPNGKKITYQEWDINMKKKGKNRGAERLITGSDGNNYYTNDHYKSFKLLKK